MRARLLPLLLVSVVAGACAQSAVAGLPPASPAPTAAATATVSPSPTSALVVVPNLTYNDLGLATSLAKADGLKIKVTSYETTMDYRPGTVVAQDPKAHDKVKPGTTVKLTLSKAPACDPSYPTICLAPFQRGVSCKTIPYHGFVVLQPDPYNLDTNGDGIGCGKAH
jgi:hypothetical protein